MTIVKRALSVFLTLLIIVNLVPVTAKAESQQDAIARIALAEEGVSGCPNKYTYAYGKIGGTYKWEWCAAFIYWCAQQAGVPNSIINKTASATVNSFGTPYYSYKSTSNIRKGDILYLLNNYGRHVGLVYDVDTDYIYTIEGNMNNAVKKYKYRRSDGYITWSTESEWQKITHYGVPDYIINVPVPTKILYPANNQVFKISSKAGSDKFLSFALTTDNVHIYENCENYILPSYVKSQYFKLTHVGSGWYTITNASTGKAVGVADASTDSGTDVQQYKADKSDAQLFRFYDAGNGYCYIKSKLGCYLDISGGIDANYTDVITYTFNGTDSQKWQLADHTHSYSSEVITEPTCTQQGSQTLTCFCGMSRTEAIAEKGHSFTASITTIPTCTQQGIQTFTCPCGESYTESLSATGHTEVIDEAIAPTQLTSGLTEGKHCSVCGEILIPQETILALCHNIVIDSVATAPTCTDPGFTEASHCTHCNEYTVLQQEIPALGHNEVTDEAIAPTCTLSGLTKGSHCSVCNEILIAQETIPETGAHTEFINHAVAPTCKNTGLTEGKTCSVCGTATVAQQTVRKLPHTYNKSTVKATLSKNGSTTWTCTSCGYVSSKSAIIYYPKTIKLSSSDYFYNGKVITPSVTVKDSEGTPLKNGTDYTVKYANGRKAMGKYSVTVTFKGKYSGKKTLNFNIVLGRPKEITATQTTSSITLKWNAVPGATVYRVYRKNGDSWQKLGDTSSLAFTAKGLKPGAAYTFAVKAAKKSGNKIIWAEKYRSVNTCTKPSAPNVTKISSVQKGTVSLTWSNVSGETGYQVYYSTKKDSGFKKLGTYKANVVSASYNKLTSKKTYYFRVRAYKAASKGNVYSSWSAVKTIKIK